MATGSDFLGSASDVWRALEKEGGLDPKVYDAAIIQDIRERLELPATGNLERLLARKKISTEDLIIAFFESVLPFSEMMSDLLRMFEKAGATKSDKNLKIYFDFDRTLPELKFDLSHFREWLELWKEFQGKFLQNVWNANLLWGLNSAVRPRDVDDRHSGLPEQVRRWLHEYMDLGVWPRFSLPAPSTGFPKLDECFTRIWQVWNSVIRECAKYGENRRAVLEAQGTESIDERWPVELLAGLASDHWAYSVVQGIYRNASILSQSGTAEREANARSLQERIENVLDKVPQIEFEGVDLIRELHDFLNLPVWQRRYELYSAWISTQILNALDDEPIRVHQIGNLLRFSFSGTHLATLDGHTPRIHLWAELRSSLKDPVGKGRKRSIQPDYSLVADPITSPESSLLEVECKQYRKPSAKNFADALTDYANGRPNSVVVLVNYGKANRKILDRVEPRLHPRVRIIGEMRPGVLKSNKEFRECVRGALNTQNHPAFSEGQSKGLWYILVDTTGSMHRKIPQVAQHILAIGDEFSGGNQACLVLYGDHGDDYVVRLHMESVSPTELSEALKIAPRTDGKDEPEALEDALHFVRRHMEQRKEGRVRIFVFADAPAHAPTECPKGYDFNEEVSQLVSAGADLRFIACGADPENLGWTLLEGVKVFSLDDHRW